MLGYSVKGNRYAIRLTKGELLELSENYTDPVLVELVDRTHVTRLQAEVGRLDRESQNLSNQLGACDRERRAFRDELESVNAMVSMLESGEWAEHAGKGPIAKKMEAAITSLVNESAEKYALEDQVKGLQELMAERLKP